MSTHHTATPAKLRDGWGARIIGATPAPRSGDTCTVKAASGKTWDATIGKVLWTGTDDKTGQPVALCTTVSDPRPRRDLVASRAAAATRAMGRRACRECGGEIQSWMRGCLCHDCE